MILGTMIFLFIADKILSLFSATQEIYHIGIPAFRIISLGFVVSTVGVVFSGVFEALGKGLQSLTITILRQMSIIPVLSFLFKNIFGLYGIWITFFIAECIAAIVSIVLYKHENIYNE